MNMVYKRKQSHNLIVGMLFTLILFFLITPFLFTADVFLTVMISDEAERA